MLKVMAATAAGTAGAALSGSGIASVMAATTTPGGQLQGSTPRTATNVPLVANTANTTYASYLGAEFHPGGSTYTWSVGGGTIRPSNGGFYFRRLHLPQGAVLTEIKYFIINPTTTPGCFANKGSLDGTSFSTFGSATPAVSASVHAVDLTMAPTPIDNSQTWYVVDFESGAATDTILYGARVGWLLNPGMTLFPNPRRVVDGFVTPFTSGGTYGPFDASMTQAGGASGVPVGATAAFCAVQSYSAGVLTIFPDLTLDPSIANFTATVDGTLNLTYMMVPLSAAGKFKIDSHITGRVFVDAWGFVV